MLDRHLTRKKKRQAEAFKQADKEVLANAAKKGRWVLARKGTTSLSPTRKTVEIDPVPVDTAKKGPPPNGNFSDV